MKNRFWRRRQTKRAPATGLNTTALIKLIVSSPAVVSDDVTFQQHNPQTFVLYRSYLICLFAEQLSVINWISAKGNFSIFVARNLFLRSSLTLLVRQANWANTSQSRVASWSRVLPSIKKKWRNANDVFMPGVVDHRTSPGMREYGAWRQHMYNPWSSSVHHASLDMNIKWIMTLTAE